MTSKTIGSDTPPPCTPPATNIVSVTPDRGSTTVTWSDVHSGDTNVVGYRLYYDQGGKLQLVEQVGRVNSTVDTPLTNGQSYCYRVATLYASCESAVSAIVCGTPAKVKGDPCTFPAERRTNHCADGFCCDTACGDSDPYDCQASSQPAGSSSNGSCEPLSPSMVCRASGGECDPAETCDGAATACPPNAYTPDDTRCAAGSGLCKSGTCEVQPDAGMPPDLGVDMGMDMTVAPDVGPDTTPPSPDLGRDSTPPSPDLGRDTTPPPSDLGRDTTASSDGGLDMQQDPDSQLAVDASVPEDGAQDAAPDALMDATPDAVADTTPDAVVDTWAMDLVDTPAMDTAQSTSDIRLSPGGDRPTYSTDDGCACKTGTTPSTQAPWVWGLIVALAMLRRRRRAACTPSVEQRSVYSKWRS